MERSYRIFIEFYENKIYLLSIKKRKKRKKNEEKISKKKNHKKKKNFPRLLFLTFTGTQGLMVSWVIILRFCF